MRTSRVFTIFSKFVLAIWLLSKVTTPDAWTALKAQTHVPARIGTAPFDQVLDVTMMFLLYVWSVIAITRLGRKMLTSDAISDVADDAFRPLERMGRQRRHSQDAYRERLEARFEAMARDTDEAALFGLLEPQRERIIDIALLRWTAGHTGPGPALRDFAEAARCLPPSTQVDSRLTTITFERGASGNSFAIAALAERLGGRYMRPRSYALSNKVHHYVVWDEPMTAYRMAQFRLYCAALELVTCTSAGKVADDLHDRLAAECRLASYQGFVLGGSNDPLDIERAVMAECRDITALDVLASAPEFELDAS